ncbi:MAG: hypothetical protein M3145_00540 [Pseudomonadota bacterium]|nr:hypothetical protein [Pseudomonadota bacterium]
MQQISTEMQRRTDECLRCWQTGLGMAMTRCLEQGGRHDQRSSSRFVGTLDAQA